MPAKKKRGEGRPPLPKSEVRNKRFTVNLSAEEKAMVKKAAVIADLKPQIYGRVQLMKAVRTTIAQGSADPRPGK